MMARRKQETVQEITAKLELAAARREVARMEAIGVTANVNHEKQDDGTMKWVARGRRIDVFQLLLERKALLQEHFNAIRDHEADLATALGFNTPERRPDHIRASVEGAPGQNITQAMIEADRRVRWVESMLTTRDAALLKALLHENDANCGRWRGTVERITGESREEAHAVAIRYMCANLHDVRDRCPPERRMAA